MKIGQRRTRSIEPVQNDANDTYAVRVIDQTKLPFALEWLKIDSWQATVNAIKTMQVRGAPLIGVTAAYGLALAATADARDTALKIVSEHLIATRPTAINLRWAVARVMEHLLAMPESTRAVAAWEIANLMANEDVTRNHAIGKHGVLLLHALWRKKQSNGDTGPLHILTHCNAGWLATVDWGTALAPVYQAHDMTVPIHVWVDETRPRNQGLITQWELSQHGVPCTLIADNAGGHLMQQGKIDCVLVGADRVSKSGDVANKIGTYLKALAARDNDVPVYVAAPSSTIDWDWQKLDELEIEERSGDEVRTVRGLANDGSESMITLLNSDQPVANPAFDVTPGRLITAIITERGVSHAAGPRTFSKLY
jgi:methylthioribose-1-phosphate isomerase